LQDVRGDASEKAAKDWIVSDAGAAVIEIISTLLTIDLPPPMSGIGQAVSEVV